jgi:hypothetical protein
MMLSDLEDNKWRLIMSNKLLVEIEIEFERSPIPASTLRRLNEVSVARDGCVWRIDKNDANEFPSNALAHNLESGLDLDLSTGALYFGRHPTGTKISKKDLDFVRTQAGLKHVSIPSLAA